MFGPSWADPTRFKFMLWFALVFISKEANRHMFPESELEMFLDVSFLRNGSLLAFTCVLLK